MTIRSSVAQSIKTFLNNKARGNIEKNSELAKLIALPTYSTGAQYTDYWLLYRYIKKHKPKEILELGPGVTTLIMAQALKENGSGRITAMEDVPQYYDSFLKSIPSYLSQFIDPHLSLPTEQRYGPFTGLGYAEIPKRDYEFVWVDGPNYNATTQFDFDLITIVQRSTKPLTAFVDSRTGSCFMYWLLFRNKFSFDYLLRTGRVSSVTKNDLKDFNRAVSRAMSTRSFPRWFSWFV